MNIENLEIRQELILAVQEALIAQAKTETIRPIVEAYQKEILEEKQYKIAAQWSEGDFADERVRQEGIVENPDHAYLISDEDSLEYFELLRQKHIENGFGDLGDKCPLLMAENKERQANNKVFEASNYIHNISPEKYVPLDKLKQMIELTKKLVVSYCSEKKISLNPLVV